MSRNPQHLVLAGACGALAGAALTYYISRPQPDPAKDERKVSTEEDWSVAAGNDMSDEQFRTAATKCIEFIIEYRRTVRQRAEGPVPSSRAGVASVRSAVQPGYLYSLLPGQAPTKGDAWKDVYSDFDRVLVPGLTHWQSPHFFAYFKPHAGYPTVLGELLSAGINVMGFSWISSPACTELETVTLNWVAKLLGLPSCFLAPELAGLAPDADGDNDADEKAVSVSGGGGVIQGSAGEACIVAMVSAKARALRNYKGADAHAAAGRLVVYLSDQTHSTVDKACKILAIPSERCRVIATTGKTNFAIDPEVLLKAMREDMEKGLIPFFVCLTVGTTSSGALDPVGLISQRIRAEKGVADAWIHVDGAWGLAFCMLPEHRYLTAELTLADSICMNAHKQLLVSFDCCCMWVRERRDLVTALSLNPEEEEYLRNAASESGGVIDYKDWQLPLGRRFRSLKLWLTLRMYGEDGLKRHLRRACDLAERFAEYVIKTPHLFTLFTPTSFSLVCFRLTGSDEDNKLLLDRVNDRGHFFLINTVLEDQVVLRVACGGLGQTEKHIDHLWTEISTVASSIASHSEQQP